MNHVKMFYNSIVAYLHEKLMKVKSEKLLLISYFLMLKFSLRGFM